MSHCRLHIIKMALIFFFLHKKMTLYEFCLLVCMFYPLNDGINFFETFESIKDNFETNIKG